MKEASQVLLSYQAPSEHIEAVRYSKPAGDYHALLRTGLGIVHATIEVHQSDERDERHLNNTVTDGYNQ